MSKEESKAIATKDAGVVNFPALMVEGNAIAEAMKANMEGEQFSAFDLETIKIPAGGGKIWSVPSIEGEIETDQLLGIILGTQNCRAWWETAFADSGGGTPPSCASEDGLVGMGEMGRGSAGNPSGLCADCPYSKFGSDIRALGQACKQISRVFFLMPDSAMPRVLCLPPTSLKNGRQYKLRLGGQGLIFHQVVTRVTLVDDKNKTGIKYSKAIFAMAGKLTAEQAEKTSAMHRDLKPLMRGIPTAEEVAGAD
jgi:hypothetical protein